MIYIELSVFLVFPCCGLRLRCFVHHRSCVSTDRAIDSHCIFLTPLVCVVGKTVLCILFSRHSLMGLPRYAETRKRERNVCIAVKLYIDIRSRHTRMRYCSPHPLCMAALSLRTNIDRCYQRSPDLLEEHQKSSHIQHYHTTANIIMKPKGNNSDL
jgi:hypothetical protein